MPKKPKTQVIFYLNTQKDKEDLGIVAKNNYLTISQYVRAVVEAILDGKIKPDPWRKK